MFGTNNPLETYKVTFENAEQARTFRDAVSGFGEVVNEDDRFDPAFKRSVQKLIHYLHRDEHEREFDFDGVMVGASSNLFLPERRFGWALDIHDIAVAVTCLAIDNDDAQSLLQDLARGIVTVSSDPSTTITTEAGLNHGPYIQLTEELEDDELTTEHVEFALERLYRGHGATDFDRERYIHPSHDIDDPRTFISSIVANVEVEGFGSTLPYLYETFVELGEDETTANLRIILHELLRMSALNLERPMVMLGASGIEEALLIKSGENPDDTRKRLSDAVNMAYSRDVISKEMGYACAVVCEVRNELGHSSWPSANLDSEELGLASSLVILTLTEFLDNPIFEKQELETLLNEFTELHNWNVNYDNGNFTVEIP